MSGTRAVVERWWHRLVRVLLIGIVLVVVAVTGFILWKDSMVERSAYGTSTTELPAGKPFVQCVALESGSVIGCGHINQARQAVAYINERLSREGFLKAPEINEKTGRVRAAWFNAVNAVADGTAPTTRDAEDLWRQYEFEHALALASKPEPVIYTSPDEVAAGILRHPGVTLYHASWEEIDPSKARSNLWILLRVAAITACVAYIPWLLLLYIAHGTVNVRRSTS